MKTHVRVIPLLFLALTFPLAARAATVAIADLPGAIQSCISATSCFVNNSSAYENGTVSAFQITQDTGSGYETNWLMRYSLVPPSGQSRLDPPLNDSFSGHLWMLAKNAYSASETEHAFTLYLDKVSPTPFDIFGHGSELALLMPTTDLVIGSSFRTLGIDFYAGDYDFGDLSGDIALPCLAQDCRSHTQLNLVQMLYGDFGASGVSFIGFDPSDSRGLVFTQSTHAPCDGDPECIPDDLQQSFYVSAVPVPAAAWLFGSGFAALLGAMQRARC